VLFRKYTKAALNGRFFRVDETVDQPSRQLEKLEREEVAHAAQVSYAQ